MNDGSDVVGSLMNFEHEVQTRGFSRVQLGMPSFQKSAIFLNIVQKAFAPPPLLFEHLSYFAGGVFCSPHLKCCINVGVREAPCKNPSASWQAIGPPQKSSKCPFVFGEGGAGSENLI